MVDDVTGQYTLVSILVVAALGSAALVALAGSALLQRRSWSYFLITLAIGALALRTFLGAVMLGGFVSLHTHHVLEHLLDVVVIGLLFTAVYAARTDDSSPTLGKNRYGHDPND